MSKYYFDGAGKALRPVIALCTAHAYNIHTGTKDPEGKIYFTEYLVTDLKCISMSLFNGNTYNVRFTYD